MKPLLAVGAILVAALLAFSMLRGERSPSEEERNRAFTESMSGITLVGKSTRRNREGLSGEERYAIDSVKHVSGDTWLFQTRLKYGSREIPVPNPITVQWAGDTPVITLTDLSIPGVGTFTARVLLYRDQYAGTWSGEEGGGQMFGKIERNNAP
jgi:hypothetical protein